MNVQDIWHLIMSFLKIREMAPLRLVSKNTLSAATNIIASLAKDEEVPNCSFNDISIHWEPKENTGYCIVAQLEPEEIYTFHIGPVKEHRSPKFTTKEQCVVMLINGGCVIWPQAGHWYSGNFYPFISIDPCIQMLNGDVLENYESKIIRVIAYKDAYFSRNKEYTKRVLYNILRFKK